MPRWESVASERGFRRAGRDSYSVAISGSFFCKFQCPAPEFGVHTEPHLIERIQQRSNLGYEALSLGTEQNAKRTDGFHTEPGGCGTCVMVIQDNPALALSGEGDCLGLAWSKHQAEGCCKGWIWKRCDREPVWRITKFLDYRWGCKHGAEQPREQIELCNALQPDEASRIAYDDLTQGRIPFSRSSTG